MVQVDGGEVTMVVRRRNGSLPTTWRRLTQPILKLRQRNSWETYSKEPLISQVRYSTVDDDDAGISIFVESIDQVSVLKL